jgi:hypothetical protein
MGLFNTFFEKKLNDPGKMMFKLTKDQAVSVIQNSVRNNNVGAEFEIILFYAGILLQHANNMKPNKINQIQEDYFKELIEYIKKNNLHNLVKQDIGDFINDRFVLYNEELIRISGGGGMAMPTKLMYNIVDSPLEPNSGENFDLGKHMLIMGALMPGLKNIEDSVKIIIQKFY